MKLDIKLKRRIWSVKWPEGISPIKLATAINERGGKVSPQLMNKWFKYNTIPDKYVSIVRSINPRSVINERAGSKATRDEVRGPEE